MAKGFFGSEIKIIREVGMKETKVLVNANVIDVKNKKIRENMDLVIVDNIIKDIYVE